jgi:DNA-binding MarR family transcriptional regulator
MVLPQRSIDDRAAREAARERLLTRVLEEQERLTSLVLRSLSSTWLAVDLTMPQLKTLLIVVQEAGTTGSHLSRCLRVGLSTVTGIVDRLCEQGLVVRTVDPHDRRATRVTATAAGQRLVSRLYRVRRERMARVLDGLDLPALRLVDEAITLLARSATAAFGVAGGQPDAPGGTEDDEADQADEADEAEDEGRAARGVRDSGGEMHAEDKAIRPLA